MAASPDLYSLTQNEVEYLKNKLHSHLILPSDNKQSQDDEVGATILFILSLIYYLQKVYTGRQDGHHVRLRAMLIKGTSNPERRQSINVMVAHAPQSICAILTAFVPSSFFPK